MSVVARESGKWGETPVAVVVPAETTTDAVLMADDSASPTVADRQPTM